MGTICLQCGDRGFTNAFVYCVRCLDFAVHRYCLDVIPETFDEYVPWVCDHCDPKGENQSTLQKCDTIACQTRDHTVSKNIKGLSRADENDMVVSQNEERGCEGVPQHSYNVRKKLDYVDRAQSDSKCSPAGKESNDKSAFSSEPDGRKSCQNRLSPRLEKLSDDIFLNGKMNSKRSATSESTLGNDQYILEKTSPNQAHEEHLNVDIRECANLVSDSQPSFKSSKKKKTVMCAEANSEEQRHKIGSAQLLEENNGLDLKAQVYDTSAERSGICLSKKINEIRESEVEEERTSALNGRSNFYKDSSKDLSKISLLDFPVIAQPLIKPIWRGSFNIWNREGNILDGLLAHMSNKACQKVHDEAIQFLRVLHLEMLPKSDVWPKSFETSEPTDENVALYFFPSEISESMYDNLVDKMMNEELAMKALLTNAELLIFSSMVLPLLHWRFKGKYYLWGVFRGRQNSSQSHSFRKDLGDDSVIHSDLSNDIGFNGGNNTMTAKSFDAQSPLSPLSNSGSNVSGTF